MSADKGHIAYTADTAARALGHWALWDGAITFLALTGKDPLNKPGASAMSWRELLKDMYVNMTWVASVDNVHAIK